MTISDRTRGGINDSERVESFRPSLLLYSSRWYVSVGTDGQLWPPSKLRGRLVRHLEMLSPSRTSLEEGIGSSVCHSRKQFHDRSIRRQCDTPKTWPWGASGNRAFHQHPLAVARGMVFPNFPYQVHPRPQGLYSRGFASSPDVNERSRGFRNPDRHQDVDVDSHLPTSISLSNPLKHRKGEKTITSLFILIYKPSALATSDVTVKPFLPPPPLLQRVVNLSMPQRLRGKIMDEWVEWLVFDSRIFSWERINKQLTTRNNTCARERARAGIGQLSAPLPIVQPLRTTIYHLFTTLTFQQYLPATQRVLISPVSCLRIISEDHLSFSPVTPDYSSSLPLASLCFLFYLKYYIN